MKKTVVLVSIVLGVVLSACSSSQSASNPKPKEQEIYVFDDTNVKDSQNTKETKDTKEIKLNKDTVKAVEEKKQIAVTETKESSVQLKGQVFIVQLGAFSSQEKAEKFVSDNKGKLNYEMKITLSETVKLFVVQLPPFATRAEAENVRNKLWETTTFKDAFIVTTEIK